MVTADATRGGAAPRLGPYTLLGRVGEGGMGVVHRAVGPDGKTVALKALRPHLAGDATGRARLASEVRVLRRVVGPHVAEVIDADVDADPPYVVTRFVDGPALDDVVRETGRLTGDPLHRLARGLASGLRDVHASGVVHRDLKPGNVLLVDGEPVVIDFGIARLAEDQRLTVTGLLVGTPGYLGPEVVSGADATPASDIHAWGATVAFAATGRPPYGRGPLEVVLYNVLQGDPDLDGVPASLAAVVRRAMAGDPAARPSAAELVTLLGPRTARPEHATVTLPVHPTVTLPAQPTQALRPHPTQALRAHPTRTLPVPPDGGQPTWPAPRSAAPYAYPQPQQYPPPYPYPPQQPERPRRRRPLLALLLLADTVAAAVLAPLVTAAALAGLLVVLRATDRSTRVLLRRREIRGRRPADGLRAIAAFPWHLLRSLLSTVLLLPLLVIAAVGTGVAATVWAGELPAAPGRPAALVAAVAVGVAAVVAWAGPGGSAVRRSTWRVLSAVAPGFAMRAVWAAILLALLTGLVLAGGATDTLWWPVDTSLVERVTARLH